jgi:outer membrane receptor protein involved in Fe transport
MFRKFKNLCVLLLLLLLIAGIVDAGTTGKIAGRVTDATTREPLVGVNVMVAGTMYGASTDIEGEYFIINLSPGIYTLKVRMVGYTSQSIEKIRVQVDLTTRVDVTLNTSAIELNTEVITVARREIQKDLSSSERTFQTDQIDVMPVRDVNSVLATQAGITRDADGALHIRGGRTSEISYMVDGVQVMNPLNRSAGISIDDQSIEELKAITGTFNAEYGQALSGVVNIVTKKGSDRFMVNATGYAGDYLSFDDKLYFTMTNRVWAEAAANALVYGRLDYDFSRDGFTTPQQANAARLAGSKPWQTTEGYLNSYDPFKRHDVQLNISGPLTESIKNISYFIAARYQNQPGAESGRRYFMPWGLWKPIMDSTHSYEMPDGALVSLGWYKGWSTQSKIFVNLGDLNLSYGLYYNDDHSYGGGQKYLPDGGRHYYTKRMTQIVSATHVFSKSTFLDVKGSYYSSKYKGYLYEDPYDYRYMPTQGGDFQEYMFRPGRGDRIGVTPNPSDFSFWGNDVNRSESIARYFSGGVDLTSQMDKVNLVKFGATARFHDLMDDNYALQFSQINYRPVIPSQSSAFHSFYTAKPWELSAYIQDKIEFEELIINVGVRFDYFNSDGRILADSRDPQIYKPFKMDHIYKNYTPTTPVDSLREYTPEERSPFWYKKTEGKYQISPRFGISFPITAEGAIHFSYGHFFQNPEFQYLYTNPNFWVAGAGAQNLVGNADLKPERTVMYELGLQQKMFDNLLIHAAGFYRDIRDWVGTGIPIDTYSGMTYYSYVNKDNATAKGITLSGSFDAGDFSFSADYTMMEAKGTSASPIDAYNDLGAGKAPRIQLISLTWDQTHAFKLIVNYAKDGWVATLYGNVVSGFPYTPSIYRGEATGTNAYTGWHENSDRRPSTMNFDLHVEKAFTLSPLKFRVLLDVVNLFDARNARYVYSDTGLPDFTMDDYQSRTRLVEISNSTEYYRNPGMFSGPRSISLGLRITYE